MKPTRARGLLAMALACALAVQLLDSYHHRFDPGQLFNVGLFESRFAHPAAAVRACIVEAPLRLDQHHQAHQHALDFFRRSSSMRCS